MGTPPQEGHLSPHEAMDGVNLESNPEEGNVSPAGADQGGEPSKN